MSTRLQDSFKSVPPCTLFFIFLCIIVFIIQLVFGGVSECAISAYAIIRKYQIYRIFTSTFTHLGLLHIAFNLLSFYNINTFLERKYGSVFMLYTVLLFSLINGILYVLIYWLLSITISSTFEYTSAAGFSGVIFSLLTLESYVIDVETLPLFGIVNIPRKWYALVYLVLMSVIMPGVSFIGHLCGVISGFFFATGYLNWLVPMHCLVWTEKGPIGSLMKKSDAFIYIPELHQALGSCLSFRTVVNQAYNGLKTIVKMCGVLIVTFSRFIFDSVFPPVLDDKITPQPASGLNSDIENDGVLTVEEARRQRLEALEARGVSH